MTLSARDELHVAAVVVLTRVSFLAGRDSIGRAPHEADAIRDARDLLPRLGQALRAAKNPPKRPDPAEGDAPPLDPDVALEELVVEARRLIAMALPPKGPRLRFLVAEPDEQVRRTIAAIFDGYADVVLMEDPAAAFKELVPGAFDVIIVDADPDSAGIALLEHVARTEREVGRVVLLRGRPSIVERELLDEVAQLALAKPLPQEHLATLLDLVPGAPSASALAGPALVFDDAEWPLVRARLTRDPSEPEWMTHEAELDAFLARGEPFALLFTTDAGARLRRPRRAALARYLAKRRPELEARLAGLAFVFGSRAARLMLAVLPVGEGAVPVYKSFVDEGYATRWLQGRLAASRGA